MTLETGTSQTQVDHQLEDSIMKSEQRLHFRNKKSINGPFLHLLDLLYQVCLKISTLLSI